MNCCLGLLFQCFLAVEYQWFYCMTLFTSGVHFLQYVPHAIRRRRVIFDRFAVLITVVIVWVYAHILTVAGAYKHRPPATQFSCRTDRSGLLRASEWYCNSNWLDLLVCIHSFFFLHFDVICIFPPQCFPSYSYRSNHHTVDCLDPVAFCKDAFFKLPSFL